MRMRMSHETADLLGKALGRWAWENGSTDDSRIYPGQIGNDMVMVEESDTYAKLCDEMAEHGDLENNSLYDTMRETMDRTARELAKKEGHRPR